MTNNLQESIVSFWKNTQFHGVSKNSKLLQNIALGRYKSLANTIVEIIWIQTLIKEHSFPLSSAPILWCDSLGANFLTANPIYHFRTKHTDINIHYVQNHVTAKTLEVNFYSIKDKLADIFIKSLVSDHFLNLHLSLRMVDTSLDLWERISIQHNNDQKMYQVPPHHTKSLLEIFFLYFVMNCNKLYSLLSWYTAVVACLYILYEWALRWYYICPLFLWRFYKQLVSW